MTSRRGRRLATHIAAFVAGVLTAATVVSEARDKRSRYLTLDSFAHSLSLVRRNYVDLISERKLVHGAIEGMIDKLDRHSSFLPPRRYRRLREDTQGEFGGVGLVLRSAPEGNDPPFPIVDDVISGSPADRATIVVGTELIAINKEPTAVRGQEKRRGRTFHSALRGPGGSTVSVSLRHGGKTRDIQLRREKVKVPSVESFRFGDSIGYVRIRRFQDATTRDVTRAIKNAPGASKLRGLVLDLRNNPGGLFDQAITVADLFLSKGVIVEVIGRANTVHERPEARAGGVFEKLPLAVLIDGNTASAAEILAGALKDHRRAKLFGKRSFGKGSVQTFYDLPDGAGLKLTTARYVSPAGTVIHDKGIEPNRDVEEFAGDNFVAGGATDKPGAALRRKWPHLAAGLAERLDADNQLLEAYSFVRGGGNRSLK